MNNSTPSKNDKPGPIKGLTLADIENNLKKCKPFEEFDNFQEFLLKAKGESAAEAYVTVTISPNSTQNEVTDEPELLNDSEKSKLRTENDFFYVRPRTPTRKSTKNRSFRFGLAPLESIEENLYEEMLATRENSKRRPQVSQQNSPNSAFKYTISLRDKSNSLLSEEKGNKRRSSIKKNVRSPYSEGIQISPQRLPAIKRSERTLRMLKSFSLVKKRKS